MTRASAEHEGFLLPSRPSRGAIGLGSNLGDRAAHLDRAVLEIDALAGVRVVAVSDWIETEPVGCPPGSPAFLNGVVLVDARVPAHRLLEELLTIERSHGRTRDSEGGRHEGEPRLLDLDLLVLGDLRLEEPGLILPHPRLEQRLVVLEPLARIAPDLRLASGRTAREAWKALRAGSAVPLRGANG
jgi:2-amino-4-hydroxy-6-hydroxymethyldihydropteridine diphosphokinase